MTDYTPEQFARLPKWAQHTITALEADLRRAHDQLGQGPAGSRVWANPYSEAPTPLGQSPTVRFSTDGEIDGTRYIDIVADDDGHLMVEGAHRLIVSPMMSNVLHLWSVHDSDLKKLRADRETP